MKVALVAAPSGHPAYRTPGEAVHPPLGLLSLATQVKDRHLVRIFDGQLFDGTPRRMAQSVLAWEPDLVGFSVNFAILAPPAREMAEYIRAQAPDVPIVFGGNHATFHWQRLIQLSCIDYVLFHEAERTFPHLLAHIARPDRALPPGLAFKPRQAACEVRHFAGYVRDLDTLPWCDYDLFADPARYVKSIATSRGCAHGCTHCSSREMWQSWRGRSARSLAAEVRALADKYRTDQVWFSDDTFLGNRQRVLDLCGLLRADGSPVQWGFPTCPEAVDESLLPDLAAAGCRSIFFACESGSERVLRALERNHAPAEILRKVELCAKHGITCTAGFVIGLPGETEADVRETFAVMQRVAAHKVVLNLYAPLNGAPSPGQFGTEGQAGLDCDRSLSAQQVGELWQEGQAIVRARSPQQPNMEAPAAADPPDLLGTLTGG